MYNYSMKSPFAKNLISLRKKKGLSQEKLAELAGVSRGTIAYYESEKGKHHIENVQAIANVLNVKIENLLDLNLHTMDTEDTPQIDSRTMKKIQLILSLSREKRYMIYTMAEALMTQEGKNQKIQQANS